MGAHLELLSLGHRKGHRQHQKRKGKFSKLRKISCEGGEGRDTPSSGVKKGKVSQTEEDERRVKLKVGVTNE